MTKRRRGPMTAEEHEAILQADPEYQARKRAAEREREERFKLIRKDARPLIAALWAVGWDVESVWDFVSYPGDYSSAYPVLVEHLKRPYHERTRDGIARALVVTDAFEVAWDTVYEEFVKNKTTETLSVEYALGLALAEQMDEPVIPQVLELVTDRGYGRNRARMVEVLVEYRDRDDVREVLEALTEDPEVGKEAKHALALRRVRRRPGRKRPRPGRKRR